MHDAMLLTSTFAGCERRKMKRIEAIGDVIVCLAKETCIAVSGNDLEVSDLIVVVDVVLDEVAVRSPMPTKRTDARLSLSGSVITVNPPWPRVFWVQIEAVCHHHLVVSEKETVIASGKEITIVLLAHAVMMTATTIAKDEIEKMNARDCIAVAPTGDHTTNLTMGMSVHPALDVVVQTMKTNTLVVIRAMLRELRGNGLESVHRLVLKNVLVRKPLHLQPRMFTPAAKRARLRRIRNWNRMSKAMVKAFGCTLSQYVLALSNPLTRSVRRDDT